MEIRKSHSFQLTVYGMEYPKESWNISVWNVYDMLIDDLSVNKEIIVSVLHTKFIWNELKNCKIKLDVVDVIGLLGEVITCTLWEAAVS